MRRLFQHGLFQSVRIEDCVCVASDVDSSADLAEFGGSFVEFHVSETDVQGGVDEGHASQAAADYGYSLVFKAHVVFCVSCF